MKTELEKKYELGINLLKCAYSICLFVAKLFFQK